MKSDDLENIKTYELASELLLDSSFAVANQSGSRTSIWKPLFWPPHFKKEHADFNLEGNLQSDANLIKLGEQLSTYRYRLRQEALKAFRATDPTEEELSNSQIQKYAKWMHRSDFVITSKEISEEHGNMKVPVMLRKRRRTEGARIPEEKLDIVYEAIIKLRKHADIAKEFRMTP